MRNGKKIYEMNGKPLNGYVNKAMNESQENLGIDKRDSYELQSSICEERPDLQCSYDLICEFFFLLLYFLVIYMSFEFLLLLIGCWLIIFASDEDI